MRSVSISARDRMSNPGLYAHVPRGLYMGHFRSCKGKDKNSTEDGSGKRKLLRQLVSEWNEEAVKIPIDSRAALGQVSARHVVQNRLRNSAYTQMIASTDSFRVLW